MIIYKGFHFPYDIPLLTALPLHVLQFFLLSKKYPAHEIAQSIRQKHKGDRQGPRAFEALRKSRRIVDYLLVRRLRFKKPCLLRSYVLLNEALSRGIPASICIGVRHDGNSLAGHSWLEIDGRPFMEEPRQIAEYTLMTKE